ncbi:ABC transporter substrate-binding protein [Cupriavidus gilardii]|uniref:ABC transporter substrate-binding protein n=1 Tax=Cupriavidus gilardii TaxID=82541 RepID=UPI003264DA4D
MSRRWAAMALAAGLLCGCTRLDAPARAAWPELAVGPGGPGVNLDAACVADYRPGVDYFPQKTAFSHSSQLQVEYGPHYKRVRFTPSVATGERLEYLLVQCGTPVPPHPADVPVILVPIQRLVTGNAAMLGALDELGLVDRLYGAENVRSVTVPSVRARIEQGLVHDMWGYGHASIEQAMSVQADVYLSFYSAYPQGNMHPRLWELGVRAIPQADHHEPHPLGRAEWLKLLALLTNREQRANDRFASIEAAYGRLSAIAAGATRRPMVMSGFAAGRHRFETFGEHNQRARLIADAGGRYVLDGGGTGSLVYLPFERVYAMGASAPAWLGTMGGQASIEAWIAANPLHGRFAAARTGNVHAWDRGYTGAWAYPYQDHSMTRPHIQLAEAIAALHPELAGEAAGVIEPTGADTPAPRPTPQFLRKLP